ncbi:MAG: DNA-binding domain-containing protein [Polyangiaceae bacterium]
MSLAETQRAFWRAVRYDPTPADALAHFEGDARLSAADRMAIYRNMYWYRQIDALGETFSVLRESLGGERFTKLACRYIRLHPSTRPALEHLGHALPELCRELEPEHHDLCRLEWARNEALLAPDPVGIAAVTEVDPCGFADSVLRFVPSLSVLEVAPTALVALGDDLDPIQAEAPALPVVVWRRGYAVRHAHLAPDEAGALADARRGATLAEVLARFPADDAGVARAFDILRGWFQRRLIEAIERRS